MQPQTAKYEDSKKFYADYWYSPYQLVTVVNPLPDDYYFKVEGRSFVVRAGTHEDVPGTVANVYLNRMAKLLAQRDRKFKHFVDWNLRAAYYNQLIVNVKNLMQDTDTTPSYLKDMPQAMQAPQGSETPPWMQTPSAPMSEASPTPQIEDTTNAVHAPPVAPPAPQPPQPETPQEPPVESPTPREFERGEDKFRLHISDNGRKTYMKNNRVTSKAEFEAAASAA